MAEGDVVRGEPVVPNGPSILWSWTEYPAHQKTKNIDHAVGIRYLIVGEMDGWGDFFFGSSAGDPACFAEGWKQYPQLMGASRAASGAFVGHLQSRSAILAWLGHEICCFHS